MAFVSKLPMVVEESRNIHPRTLPHPPGSSLGKLDPVSTGIQAAETISSTVASLAPSGSIIGVNVGGGVVLGLSTIALAGVGLALAVVSIIYNLIMNNQKKVEAMRQARHLRWEAFYENGIALINEVYGSTKDFDRAGWSRAHSTDEGFGEYYGLGAQFYWWKGGGSHRDLSITEEGFRELLLSTIKGYGLDPTRIMGYQNVGLDEELNPENSAFPEKVLTAKEILVGAGYSPDQINNITLEDPLALLYDVVVIDFPKVKTEDEAKLLLNNIDIFLSSMGLDSSIFFKKVNASSLPAPTNSGATVVQQPVQVVTSQVDPSIPQTQSIPTPTAAPTIPIVASAAPEPLAAGMPIWGWILIGGIALSGILRGKFKKEE